MIMSHLPYSEGVNLHCSPSGSHIAVYNEPLHAHRTSLHRYETRFTLHPNHIRNPLSNSRALNDIPNQPKIHSSSPRHPVESPAHIQCANHLSSPAREHAMPERPSTISSLGRSMAGASHRTIWSVDKIEYDLMIKKASQSVK